MNFDKSNCQPSVLPSQLPSPSGLALLFVVDHSAQELSECSPQSDQNNLPEEPQAWPIGVGIAAALVVIVTATILIIRFVPSLRAKFIPTSIIKEPESVSKLNA